MYIEVILLFLTIFLCGIKFYPKLVRPKNFPPGPHVLPIVGSLPFLGSSPFNTLLKWSSNFGPVIGLYMGSFRAIIITDYELIKSVFSKEESSGRPEFTQFLKSSGPHRRGISFTDGRTWKEQRTFTFTNLKDMGFGKEKMEGMIIDDIEEFCRHLPKDGKTSISIHLLTRLTVLRSLWTITTGHSYPLNDTELTEISKCFSSGVQKVGFGGAALFFPWITKLFPNASNYTNLCKALDKILEYLNKQYKIHYETYKESKSRDYMDIYINKIKETTNPSSSFYSEVGEENLKRTCMNIFGAGTEPTSSTLNWAILQLALQPEFQSKIKQEIDETIGQRTPSLIYKKSMEYTGAFMLEVLRTVPTFPFILPHRTLDTMALDKYIIPKNTLILGSTWLVNQNPQLWENASSFLPERWIGERKEKNPPLITFSVGLRACPGETYGKNALFLFITCILQKYRVELDDETKYQNIKCSKEPFKGVPDFQVRFIPI